MAAWPPVYDENYLPDPSQRHWFPALETMAEEQREGIILSKLQAVVRYAWERSPFYRQKWEQAGVHPDHLKTLQDLERFPVVQKHELRQEQAGHPPFGRYLCIPPEEVLRIHGTHGTTGKPTGYDGRPAAATLAPGLCGAQGFGWQTPAWPG